MSAWTPGPWQIERVGDAWVKAIRSPDGRAVCYGSIADADALLIVAAPELVEALIDLLSAASDEWPQAAEKARAALAKAGAK